MMFHISAGTWWPVWELAPADETPGVPLVDIPDDIAARWGAACANFLAVQKELKTYRDVQEAAAPPD